MSFFSGHYLGVVVNQTIGNAKTFQYRQKEPNFRPGTKKNDLVRFPHFCEKVRLNDNSSQGYLFYAEKSIFLLKRFMVAASGKYFEALYYI